jgi:RimJ/RimL family protein N-acetyltransferase
LLYKSEKIKLRKFKLSDVNDVYLSWLNDRTYMKYSNQRHMIHTHASASEYALSFENSSNLFLSIEDSNSRFIGTCTVYYDPNNHLASLGVLISPEASGKGAAKEVFKILLSELPRDLVIHKIIVGTCEMNQKMISVIKNSDMKFEYCEPEEFLLDGRYLDNLIFAKYF